MNKINVLELCKDAENIGIGGHVRPDGDCVGSCMALYLYLKKEMPSRRICVFLEKPSEIYDCLKGVEDIKTTTAGEETFDVFFALDCTPDRLGDAGALFEQAKLKVNIDHHISNEKGYGDVNYIVPDASSTSELIYDLIEKSKVDMEIAKAVYLGIIHDTGVFQYSNTSPKTMRIGAELIAYGFDFPRMIDETFYEKTYIQNQILGRALLESVLFMNGRCIFSVVDKKTMDFYGAKSSDLSGVVNQLRIIKGVDCAIFLHQTGVMEYKVSMRSGGKVNVAVIASFFGGGGHVRAAGCTMNGTVHDVVNNLSLHIEKQYEKKDETV